MKWAVNKAGVSVSANEAFCADAFYCEECHEPVTLRPMTRRRDAHFAHYAGSRCPRVESTAHLRAEPQPVALTTVVPSVTITHKEKLFLALLASTEAQLVEMDRKIAGMGQTLDVSFVWRSRAYAIFLGPHTMAWQEIDRRLEQYTARTYPIYTLWTAPLPETLKEGEPYLPDEWESYIHALSYGSIAYYLDQTSFFVVHLDPIEEGSALRMPVSLGVHDLREFTPYIRRDSFIAPPFELRQHAILYKRRPKSDQPLVRQPEKAFL